MTTHRGTERRDADPQIVARVIWWFLLAFAIGLSLILVPCKPTATKGSSPSDAVTGAHHAASSCPKGEGGSYAPSG